MNNFVLPKWLWGQLSYVIPLLVGAALVAHRMPRRKSFALRAVLSCVAILSAKMVLDILLVRSIDYGSRDIWVMVNLMLSVLLYLLVSFCTTLCFECDLFAGLFCGTIGYSLQHIAQRLYMIYSYSPIAGNAVQNGVVLTLITILVYIIIYLVMLRKVRFCTVIVDNRLQIAISTIFIMDKKQYRSYSKAIVAAVNDYFGRQEQLAADPYLETREKEDAFLQRIESTICNALRFAPVPMAAVQPSTPMQTEPEPADDDLSTALDFADSF